MSRPENTLSYNDFWTILGDRYPDIPSFRISIILKQNANIDVEYIMDRNHFSNTHFKFASEKDKLTFILKYS